MTVDRNIKKKMCVVGDETVGKTSLIRRFVVDRFDDKYIATIGTKTSKKTLTIKGDNVNVNLKLMIWDILGQKKFSKLKESAFKGTNGAFVVLDLTRRETLYSFDSWLLPLQKVAGEIPIVVLANKNDLKTEFGKDEIEKLVKEYGFPYYLTSAKTGENVGEAFRVMGKMMIKARTAVRKEPHLEMAKSVEMGIETETDLHKQFTALEVEDMIMARYCNLLDDPDLAMAIIRVQFKRIGVDFKNPTVEGLAGIVDYLIDAASDHVEASRLEKERKTYANLIRRIN